MSNTCRIIGIDPGGNTGIAVIYVDTATCEITKVSTYNLNLDILTGDIEYYRHIKRVGRLVKFAKRLFRWLTPQMICMETAFLNSRFPQAVMALSTYIAAINIALYNADIITARRDYPPKLVKSTIGAGGTATKDDMLLAITSISELSNCIDTSILTEHEVDALAIAYIGYREFKQNKLVAYMW